jgi:GR25 family glycosyltransferase involved in LPS biosynthesis
MQNFFDAVFVISLRRRPERLKRFWEAIERSRWPFRPPEVVEAVDGATLATPPGWQPAFYGCYLSHLGVFRRAWEKRQTVLIMEDDVSFPDCFAEHAPFFLDRLPADWDGLYFGCSHALEVGRPEVVVPSDGVHSAVIRCLCALQTHCYAVRGPYIAAIIEACESFRGAEHIDGIMARLHPKHRVYAPSPSLAGYDENFSEVIQVRRPADRWDMHGTDRSLIR